jgi:hypothetical protein
MATSKAGSLDTGTAKVLRLTIPARGPVRPRHIPARVIPLYRHRTIDERREILLSLIGIAVMLAIAFIAFVIAVRSAGGVATVPYFPGPWW